MSIAGNDVLKFYDGQPPTCYRCKEPGHVQVEYTRRKRLDKITNDIQSTWADIVSNKTRDPHQHRSSNQTVNETEDRHGNNPRTKNENTTPTQEGRNKTCIRRILNYQVKLIQEDPQLQTKRTKPWTHRKRPRDTNR